MKYIYLLLLAVMPLSASSQLLWRITGKGLTSPSYVFGTMHLSNPKAFNFSDSVLIALQATKAFALETDFDSTMQLLSGQNQAVMSDTANYIRPYLNDQEYNYTNQLLAQRSNYTIESLPLKIFPTVTGLILKDSTAPHPGEPFLDMWLYQKASMLGKRTTYLEKLQNQIDIFYPKTITPEDKIAFLTQIGYIDDHGAALRKIKQQQDSMSNLYYAGNLQGLADLILPDPAASKLRLDTRNVEMTYNLLRHARDSSIFACVGAAHLPGKHGIIALLRKQGFTVTPVPQTYTGITQRERQHLDSLTGLQFSRPEAGFSLILPAYPQRMHYDEHNTTLYAATNFSEGGLVMYQDVLTPGNNEYQIEEDFKAAIRTHLSYFNDYTPITYKGIPGLQGSQAPINIRVFITHLKAYAFVYVGTDTTKRDQFFNAIQLFTPGRQDQITQ